MVVWGGLVNHKVFLLPQLYSRCPSFFYRHMPFWGGDSRAPNPLYETLIMMPQISVSVCSLQVYVQPGSYSVDTVAEKSNSPSQSQLAWTAQERTYIVHALLVQMIPVTPQI